MQNTDGIVWEVKSDGMYLTVSPQAAQVVDFEVMRRELDNEYIVNYNADRIKEILRNGRGKPEFAGKHFQRFNPDKEDFIKISVRPEKVVVNFSSKIEQSEVSWQVSDIEYLLRKKGVSHGVNWGLVSDLIQKKRFNEDIQIASASAPTVGKDAKIEELVRIDPDARPVLLADGTADFKNLHTMTQIEAGKMIAVKHPPTAGKPGMNVYGEEIPAGMGLDFPLPCGKNTEISEDGFSLKAKLGGYLYRDEGRIGIGLLYIVVGDVGYKTGNIQYSGDVLITGNVLPDFAVESDGDIKIEGEVESAKVISKNGKVEIQKGIFGHGKAYIFAKKDIHLTLAQDANIECEGTLFVKKGIRNCIVRAENIDASSKGCLVCTGKLTAYNTVTLAQVGVESSPTQIFIVDRQTELLSKKLGDFKKTKEKMLQAMEPLEKRIKSLRAMIEKMGAQVSPRSQNEVKTAIEQYTAMKRKIEFVETQIEKVSKEIVQPVSFPGRFKVLESASDAYLDMYGFNRELGAADIARSIIWTPEGLAFDDGTHELAPKEPPQAHH